LTHTVFLLQTAKYTKRRERTKCGGKEVGGGEGRGKRQQGGCRGNGAKAKGNEATRQMQRQGGKGRYKGKEAMRERQEFFCFRGTVL
jgi:hypothetical protein